MPQITHTAKVVIEEHNGSATKVIAEAPFYQTNPAELSRLANLRLGDGQEDILLPDVESAVRVLKAWMAGRIHIYEANEQTERMYPSSGGRADYGEAVRGYKGPSKNWSALTDKERNEL
jgi:hypothetical protein